MKKINIIILSAGLLAIFVLVFSQNSELKSTTAVNYTKSIDNSFSGGNNGGWGGNLPADVMPTINAQDGIMDVAVNKVNNPLSVLWYYMGNCWTDKLIFDQKNRYIEFRIKSSAPVLTPQAVGPWGSMDDCKPQVKNWTNPTYTIPVADVWTIILLKVPPTTGGSQNVLDTVGNGIAFNFPNGNYSFDYIKMGNAAIPPIPTMDVVKTKTVQANAGVQNVTLTGIRIPNRLLDGLDINAESMGDGIVSDVTILDLGSGKLAADDLNTTATAALQFTPVPAGVGLSDSIIITLTDSIRGTQSKFSFCVKLIQGSCTATIPSASDVTLCSGKTVILTATGGTNYRWYDLSSGGTLLGSSASFTTPTLTSTTTYYVANYDGTCESTRKAVSAIVTTSISPKITALVNTHFLCNSAPEQLYATPSGGTFSGDGVELGYFIPSQAKVNHINSIYYNYGDFASGCYGKDSLHVFVFPCIGLEDETESGLIIYPNPSTGIFTILTDNIKEESVTIQIFDDLGRLMLERKRQTGLNSSENIDLSAFPRGIYTVKVIMKEKVISSKVIINTR